jgi:hypothetical protein
MGFPWGNGFYGLGLYSRRPDWWRDKTCVNDEWAAQSCDPPAWTPSQSADALPAWSPAATETPAWTPIQTPRARHEQWR